MDKLDNVKKIKLIIVIIIIILILIFLGFVLYSKMESDKTIDNNINNTNNTTKEDNNISTTNEVTNNNNQIKKFKDYPLKSDKTAIIAGELNDLLDSNDKSKINLSQNYKDIDIKVADVDLIFNCVEFGTTDANICVKSTISLNDKAIYEYDIYSSNPYIIVNDQYIVITSKQSFLGTMQILNKNGDKLFELEIVNSYRATYDGNNIRLNPNIKDNILYFATYKDSGKLSFNCIDLLSGTFEVNSIENFVGYIGEF